MVLDETSSFADPENEAKMQRPSEALMKGKTVLMIAHRLSTVRNMDRIQVVRDGEIAEGGKHDELLKGRRIRRHVGGIPKGAQWKRRRCSMIERIRKKIRHDGEGYKRLCGRRVLVRTGQHQQKPPVGVLATAFSGIVEALTNGTDPGAGLTRFWPRASLPSPRSFVTFLIQCTKPYTKPPIGRAPTAASGWRRCCASSRCPSSETVT